MSCTAAEEKRELTSNLLYAKVEGAATRYVGLLMKQHVVKSQRRYSVLSPVAQGIQ